jgi:hypothetical protein
MTTDPGAMSEVRAGKSPQALPRHPTLLVAEDWLLAAWVAVVTPLLFRAQGGAGPFDAGAPLLGVLRLAAVLGALVCLAARQDAARAVPRGRSLTNSGAVGPLCGGMLLVAISGFTALRANSAVGVAVIAAFVVVMVVVHEAVPPLSVVSRRALVTPFVMVSGGLFWTFIAEVSGEPGSASPAAAVSNPQTAVAAIAFLLAFSAVFYAMLVYAPRQVAEREGGLLTWVLRYALFVAGVAFGIAWPRLFGV